MSKQGELERLVASVRDLGIQFRGNDVDITGQDGATSLLLPNGNALWIFGDTIEGPFDSIRYHDLTEALSNTGSLIPPQDASNGIRHFEYLKTSDGKRPRQVVNFLPDEDPSRVRLWAIHGICVGEWVYLFYHKITMDPELDVFETFTLDGMGIARAHIHDLCFERLTAPDGSTMFWKGDLPSFGVFVHRHADGLIYLMGSLKGSMYLARTHPERIADIDDYEYLVDGPTLEDPDRPEQWSWIFEPTVPLFGAVPNEMSVSWNPYLQRFVALHTFERFNRLALRTAPHITGPWSNAEIFFRPEQADPEMLFNAGKEHPELAREDGRVIYMTYINSAEYMPHLVEITFAQ